MHIDEIINPGASMTAEETIKDRLKHLEDELDEHLSFDMESSYLCREISVLQAELKKFKK